MGPHPATAPRGSTADTIAPGQAAPPDTVVLTSDIIELPAAASFDDAGFHAPVLIQTRIPTDAPAQAGGRIVLVRRDDGRPRQTCGSQHPLSVCATLDWSDFPDRPGVSPQRHAGEPPPPARGGGDAGSVPLGNGRSDRRTRSLRTRLTTHRCGRIRPILVRRVAGGVTARRAAGTATLPDQVWTTGRAAGVRDSLGTPVATPLDVSGVGGRNARR